MANHTKEAHLDSLDALRGIAILNVMLVHAVYWGADHVLPLRSELLRRVAFAGQRGVQLFFLVSAFTLYMSYERRKHEARPTQNFFIRRVFRLTPMLYLAVVLTWFLWPAALGTVPHAALSMVYLSHLSPTTITSGAAGAWSVATEAGFYLILPFLFLWINNGRRALGLLGICTAFILVAAPRIIAAHGSAEFWYFQSLPANMPTFAMGILAFYLWRRWIRPPHALGQPQRKYASALLLCSFAGFYLAALPFSIQKTTAESAIFLLLMLALLLHPWSLLVNKITTRIGELSFSLYLLHFYVARFVERLLTYEAAEHAWARHSLLEFWAEFFLTLGLTLPLAAITWKWVETPGIAFGRRIIQVRESASRGESRAVPA